MPQWAGSCWYYLRFLSPTRDDVGWDPAEEKYWMPVDLYVGGSEHATLHLLYARFWHKVLYDAGHVSTKDPFPRLVLITRDRRSNSPAADGLVEIRRIPRPFALPVGERVMSPMHPDTADP